jgi:hypothetical protein
MRTFKIGGIRFVQACGVTVTFSAKRGAGERIVHGAAFVGALIATGWSIALMGSTIHRYAIADEYRAVRYADGDWQRIDYGMSGAACFAYASTRADTVCEPAN